MICSVLAVGLAGACGKKEPAGSVDVARGGSGGGSGSGGTGGNAASVELKIAWWGSQDRHDRTIKVVEKFREKHPHVKFTWEYDTASNYWPKMRAHGEANTLPDIMQQDYAYIGEFVDKGRLLALDDVAKSGGPLNLSDVAAPIIDGGKIKGKLYGVALGTNTQCWILDVDAFAKAGVALPTDTWTWEDFEKASLEIKAKSNIFGYGSALYLYTPWKALFLSAGTWVFKPDNSAVGWEDDTPWVEHWKREIRLQKAGAVPTYEEEKRDFPDSANVEKLPIVAGKAAMEQIHSNQLLAIMNAAGMNRNFKLVAIPRLSKGGSSVYIKPSQYWSVTSGTKHPKEAAMFIDFFTNDIGANEILAAERGVPIAGKVATALKSQLGKGQLEAFDLIERVGKDARPLPPADPPQWGRILNEVYMPKVTIPILSEQITPEAGVALFKREANAILAGTAPPPAMDAGVPADGGGGGADAGTSGDAKPADASSDATSTGDGGGGTGGLSFFVTSTGSGAVGGNLGGLVGADKKCEDLATAVGAGGKGWKAFLSVNAEGATAAVNAKDRIGAGPWRNQKGQMVAANVAQLLMGVAANLIVDEKGATVPGNQHDILTGSRPDGTAYPARTCANWTATTGQSWVGHSDGAPAGRFSAHGSGCTEAGLRATAGAGRFYCFATAP